MIVRNPFAAAVAVSMISLLTAAPGLAQEIVFDTVAGPAKLSRTAEGHKLSLAGRPVAVFSGARFVSAAAAFPDEERPAVLVYQISEGGQACPALYRVIDFRRHPVYVSAPFGTCSDLAEFEPAGAGLVARMPEMTDGAKPAWATWTYRGGPQDEITSDLGADKPVRRMP